jgi:quercetin dioxygenase-like cupin family protein
MSGCVVAAEAMPAQRQAGDVLSVRPTLDAGVGCEHFAQAVLRVEPGRAFARASADHEELLFVLDGQGTLSVDGREHALEPETGAHVRAGERYELENRGPGDLTLVSVLIPDPEPSAADGPAPQLISRVADQATETATTDREFRVVFGPEQGCGSVTQFVGYIPTARAPDHYHLYDEVIYVLSGEGVMHMEGEHTPLASGSCIHLPARTVHCLENAGTQTMRVLGVFRPAGSPAAAYYPDGTSAYAAPQPA